MGIIRQKRKAETRALLLQAGLGVFAERGIEFATLDDIAQTAVAAREGFMVYLPWLVILLIPYWLGPIMVWLTQKARTSPVFERFTPGRHFVPENVAGSFRQTCDALATEGFRVVAELFQTGQMRHVSTRVALLEHPETADLALAVAMFTAARPARLVASYAELPTKFRDGPTVSVHNSPVPGSFTPPPSRIVVRLPIVRDPARLVRVKRAYLDRHYREIGRASCRERGRICGVC